MLDWGCCNKLSDVQRADTLLYWFLPEFDFSSVSIADYEHFRAQKMSKARFLEFERGRQALRLVLGSHLKAGFDIENELSGRLVVVARESVEVSLSHFGCDVLVGVSFDGRVGVDILKIKVVDSLRLAKRILQDAEFKEWVSVAAVEQSKNILLYWSIKEAMIKCVGGSGWQMKEWRLSFNGVFCKGYNAKLQQCCYAIWSIVDEQFIVAVAKLDQSIFNGVTCIKA